MSFIRIDGNNLEYTGVQLHPTIQYESSSIGEGITGSMFVAPIRSDSFKKMNEQLSNIKTSYFFASIPNELGTDESRNSLFNVIYNSSLINQPLTYAKNSKDIPIYRFDGSYIFDGNFKIKNHIRKVLMPYHSHRYQNSNYSYSNYHTVNFFKNDNIPTGSVFLYANNDSIYDLSNPFSINFWINPRNSTNSTYDAGTIFHLSSSIAISLVSGSSYDEKGEIDSFKILLQLSHSADILPDTIDLNNPNSGGHPRDLIYTSSHELKKNNWHNVMIQWGNAINNGTGSLYIDDNETEFYIPSSSLASSLDVPALCIGNFYNGNFVNLGKILGDNTALGKEAFTPNDDYIPSLTPTLLENTFRFPLNAEVHEIKMFNKYFQDITRYRMKDTEKNLIRKEGMTAKDFLDCQFYLPPFFYPEGNNKYNLVSPYYFNPNLNKQTTPFNDEYSFRVAGKILNLENFVVDFKNKVFPRLINLIPTTDLSPSSDHISAESHIYNSGSNIKRNISILPNDNGLFKPNFDIYKELTSFNDYNRFDTPGDKIQGSSLVDYSIINLENLISSSTFNNSWSAPEDLSELDPNQPISIYQSVGPNPVYTGMNIQTDTQLMWIPQSTRDISSNDYTVFDISNLYYGNRIFPNSFSIESKLTGSNDKINILLKDNGMGSLYRADAKTKHATWNNIGNVFYDEGLVMIKSPHLCYFGKDHVKIGFKGEQNIHTMILNVPAYKRLFNSSSNPTFERITPSDNANDAELDSFYITTVNIHDDNFNIIMKANFSQPIIKTKEDEFVIRLKEDF